MRFLLIIASFVMLSSAEPPSSSGYSTTRTSGGNDLNFQPVPSVAQIHIPPSPQTHSPSYASSQAQPSYASPQTFSTLEKQYPGPQISYNPHYTSPHPHHYAPPPSRRQFSLLQSASSNQNLYSAPEYSPGPQSNSFSPSPQYNGPPASPPQQYSSPANVQVSYGAPPQLPPGASYGPPPMIQGAGPDHNVEYRVVYIPKKAPKPDLVLPPPPPQQKTVVYILVPRFEPPEPIIVPTHPPTPPSKPEVYFIRYKAPKKNKSSPAPSNEYGAPFVAASGEFSNPLVVAAPRTESSIFSSVTSSTSAGSESTLSS